MMLIVLSVILYNCYSFIAHYSSDIHVYNLPGAHCSNLSWQKSVILEMKCFTEQVFTIWLSSKMKQIQHFLLNHLNLVIKKLFYSRLPLFLLSDVYGKALIYSSISIVQKGFPFLIYYHIKPFKS